MAKKKSKERRLFTIGILKAVGGDSCPRFTNIVEYEFKPMFWDDDIYALYCTDIYGVHYEYRLADDETLFVNFTNLIK